MKSGMGSSLARVAALGALLAALAGPAGAPAALAQEVEERVKTQEQVAAETPAPEAAPATGWQNSLAGSLTFAQTSFSNWAEGGTNSAAWQASGNGVFKRLSPARHWTTTLKLEYGEVDAADTGTRKALDLIFVESIVDFQTTRHVKPYIAATAKTQFARGYDYKASPVVPVSDFADPLLLTQSAGIGFRPRPWLATRLGGAMQETFTDEFRQYSDDPDTPDELEKTKVEGGLESVTTVDRWLNSQLNIKSRLALFWAFNNSDQVDMDWMNDVTVKALGAIGVSFKLHLIYNKDVLDKVQLKQIFGVGINYTFI